MQISRQWPAIVAASSASRPTRSAGISPSPQNACSAGRQPDQVARARSVELQEGREHRGDQHARREHAARSSPARAPLRSRRSRSRAAATRPCRHIRRWRRAMRRAAGRVAELHRQLAQQLCRPRSPRVRAICVAQRFRHGEVLEQRDDVGEASWKASTSGLVASCSGDAVRRAARASSRARRCRATGSEHQAARQFSPVDVARAEVAEQQRAFFRAVIGVRLAQGVRVDAQAADDIASLGPRR